MIRLAIAFAAAAIAVLPTLPAAAADQAPVVVELFTSQGCSSCPPADAYLGELAKQKNVIALAFHVDYWDYIGWKDRYAIPEATARQRRYTEALGNRYLYTPQIVVEGRSDATGSDRGAVARLVDAELAISRDKVPLAVMERSASDYTIKIPASNLKGSATVWLAVFDKEHATDVAHGENGGRTLKEFNIVREWRKAGRYDGKAVEIPVELALKPENGCAVLLQADNAAGDGQGPILGATLVSEN
jgi:hypothetical protein